MVGRRVSSNLTSQRVCVALLGAVYGIAHSAGVATASRGKGSPFQRGGDGNKDRGIPVADCRVAVCLSGAIRSFVHPAVYRSIRHNLIKAIEADGCEVDVFAYATRKDVVSKHGQPDNSEFTPNSTDIETAMDFLAPTRLTWHQEQAGIIPSSCASVENEPYKGGSHTARDVWFWGQTYNPGASRSLFWQMYKSLAAYRMALREETKKGNGFTYDWIIRGRFDVAWVRPLPPLRQFSREAVWFARHYWPMSDHFALVPRVFSDRFFGAIKTFYACDGHSWPPPDSWWQPECPAMGFVESVFFRFIHASGVPYRFYPMFDYVITRGATGGMCHLGFTMYSEVCNLLHLLQPSLSSHDCVETLAEYANLRCQMLLPTGGLDDARRVDAIIAPEYRAWEALGVASPSLESRPVAPPPVSQEGTGTSRHASPRMNVANDELVRRAISKLTILRDAIRLPLRHETGDDSLGLNNFGAKSSSRSGRWDSWAELPLWWIVSVDGCPLAQAKYPGRTPHIVLYYTLGTPLLRELVQAVRCFLFGATTEPEGGSVENVDWGLCEEIRPLDQVMIEVSLQTEELGICTADGHTGLEASEQVSRFFKYPEAHCVGYGRLGS